MSAGNVGIGTNTPTEKLTVANGSIKILTAGQGLIFADNSAQTTAALTDVQHDTTLNGSGTVTSPLSVANLGVNTTQLADSAVTGAKMAVPLELTGSNANAILSVTNTGGGAAISATGAIDTSTQYNLGGQRVLSVPGSNTFVGLNTGLSNTTGFDNSFFGTAAGRANTTGSRNSFFGVSAGRLNTTGSNNTFVGVQTGIANTTGFDNSFFGAGAGNSNRTGTSNSFFGAGTGGSNTTGSSNSFFGIGAGLLNTTGLGNSFVGAFAGENNTTGDSNSFFGSDAGILNTIGVSNSLFGATAGFHNTTGSFNSFFGRAAGALNTTGTSNSFFGHNAGSVNTTGAGNTIIGVSAGTDSALGDNNTLIGFNAQGSAGITNATAIGAGAHVTTSNTMVLGTSAVAVQVPGSLNVSGLTIVGTLGAAGSTQLCRNASNQLATCSSSLRYKTEVHPFISGLEIVRRLHPISFTWRDHPARDLGLAAEEVAEIEPLLVTRNAEGAVEGVKYDHLNVVLINAIQQQQAQIKEQQDEIEKLKRLICLDHPQAQVCTEMK